MKTSDVAVRAEAAKFGASVSECSDGLSADAPAGKLWITGDCHSLLALTDHDVMCGCGCGGRPLRGSRLSVALADLVERMSMGLRDCDQDGCDCREDR